LLVASTWSFNLKFAAHLRVFQQNFALPVKKIKRKDTNTYAACIDWCTRAFGKKRPLKM
jgi:hypothetical protein